jgi:alkylation response protein AidB-like acyl-CoA dehydrogenase
VNFDFNDEQRAIKEAARDMLAKRYPLEEVRRLALEEERGFTDEQWAELASLGWPGIFVSEEDGGQGLGIVELVILQEELGYALAPTPFFSNACAGLLVSAAGTDEQRERFLGPLAAGEARGTVALWDEGQGRSPTDVGLEATGSSLTGTKVAVPDAGSADFIVVAASGGRHFVVQAGDEGVEIEPAPPLDPTRKLFTVRLHGAEGHQLEHDIDATDRAWWAMCAALAAESTGVAQRAMEMAVEYAKDRKQFDRPIGAYQAVSHRCAQMLLEVEGARSVTYYAGWALDHEPESAPLAAAMAKAYASDAGWRVPAAALQVLGGIGFTWEHDLHFWLKRGRANAAAWGDARWHRARVADLIGI